MTAYKIDVQCNNCKAPISFILYETKKKLICPLCGYEEGKASPFEGFIYIMWNKSLPDYIKVGYAADPERRAKEHSVGSVPGKYEIVALFPSNRIRDDEKKALKKLKKYKDKSSKEIFKLCPALATTRVQNSLNKRELAFLSSKFKENYNEIIEKNRLKALPLGMFRKPRQRRQNTLFDD